MRKVIYVLSQGQQWKIQCEHCGQTVFNRQSDAIASAKNHVAGLVEGTLSQIIIQDDNGKFRAEWTYGEDPFPPRG